MKNNGLSSDGNLEGLVVRKEDVLSSTNADRFQSHNYVTNFLAVTGLAASLYLGVGSIGFAQGIPSKTSDGRSVVMPSDYRCPPIKSEYHDPIAVNGKQRPKKRNFGDKIVDVKPHSGQDIPVPIGTPVVATCDGEVELADYYFTTGNRVMVKCDYNPIGSKQVYEITMHHNKLMVAKGNRVTQGKTVLAQAGRTGDREYINVIPHVHRELWEADGYFVVGPESVNKTRVGMISFQFGAMNVNPNNYWNGAKGSNPVTIPPTHPSISYDSKKGYTYPVICLPSKVGSR